MVYLVCINIDSYIVMCIYNCVRFNEFSDFLVE